MIPSSKSLKINESCPLELAITLFDKNIGLLVQWWLAPLLLNRLAQWGKPPLDRLTKIVKEPNYLSAQKTFKN
jgi:hypothetical protein